MLKFKKLIVKNNKNGKILIIIQLNLDILKQNLTWKLYPRKNDIFNYLLFVKYEFIKT